ncbi:hypothetical protein CBR_g2723 [Chara braunii]|uniref:Reverse transcriptase domain-containing protein n=1 Tax=Chara braunii TaxID=69332 RepID=A0A388KDR1_CHABU|nr:hypothetical protein CBR_g2723 [Chara braunii]|eukprot:GBG68171.1 hypothetical protein CBR_g2723 [Chara braunii]
MVDTRSGKSTTPYTKAQEEQVAAVLRERKKKQANKELIKEAKKLVVQEEQAAKKKKLEEEMVRLKEEEEKMKEVDEEEIEEVEEDELEEPSFRRGAEQRAESNGTKEDLRMEKNIYEWVANLSLGEEEEVMLLRKAPRFHDQWTFDVMETLCDLVLGTSYSHQFAHSGPNWIHNDLVLNVKDGKQYRIPLLGKSDFTPLSPVNVSILTPTQFHHILRQPDAELYIVDITNLPVCNYMHKDAELVELDPPPPEPPDPPDPSASSSSFTPANSSHLVASLTTEAPSVPIPIPTPSTPASDAAAAEKFDNLLSSLQPSVVALLREYRDVFPPYVSYSSIPPMRDMEHRIRLEPNYHIQHRAPYRISVPETQELKRQIDELLRQGFIKTSTSPWSALVLFDRKKDDTLRLCLDYHGLNEYTARNSYPMSRADDLFDCLSGHHFFTKIDLRSGYHQICVAEEDQPKTAFRSRFGHYEFTVMPFGLRNAPATFQAAMNTMFQDVLEDSVLVYIDDILVYNRTLEEHLFHLRTVLQRLRDHGFYAKLSKCCFAQTKVDLLGHQVSEHGLYMDDSKIQAIVDWPTPTSLPALRSFLGLTNYYGHFLKNYVVYTAQLTPLTRGRLPFHWTPAHEDAFCSLKRLVTSALVLHLPDYSRPFIVTTDTSDFAIGAVLSQIYSAPSTPLDSTESRLPRIRRFPPPPLVTAAHLATIEPTPTGAPPPYIPDVVDDGTVESRDGECPVAYLSRQLLPTERNYTIEEREMGLEDIIKPIITPAIKPQAGGTCLGMEDRRNNPKRVVLLLGSRGSGKTTVANLILQNLWDSPSQYQVADEEAKDAVTVRRHRDWVVLDTIGIEGGNVGATSSSQQDHLQPSSAARIKSYLRENPLSLTHICLVLWCHESKVFPSNSDIQVASTAMMMMKGVEKNFVVIVNGAREDWLFMQEMSLADRLRWRGVPMFAVPDIQQSTKRMPVNSRGKCPDSQGETLHSHSDGSSNLPHTKQVWRDVSFKLRGFLEGLRFEARWPILCKKAVVVLFGPAGVGKSTIANMLIQGDCRNGIHENVFHVEDGPRPGTLRVQKGETHRWIVYDTVGLGGFTKQLGETLHGDATALSPAMLGVEILSYLTSMKTSIDYFCFVVRAGRINELDKSCAKLFKYFFETLETNFVVIATSTTSSTWIAEYGNDVLRDLELSGIPIVGVDFPRSNPSFGDVEMARRNLSIRLRNREVLINFLEQLPYHPRQPRIQSIPQASREEAEHAAGILRRYGIHVSFFMIWTIIAYRCW